MAASHFPARKERPGTAGAAGRGGGGRSNKKMFTYYRSFLLSGIDCKIYMESC
jgi:hypothetical protein